MFKLHDFEYDYHYDLAKESVQSETETESKCARIEKREMSEEEEKREKKRKKSKKSKKRKSNKAETQHLYLDSDALDAHYEENKKSQNIPKSFAASTRLTKSELVEIVSAHFLSQPLLTELNEIDVIKQFLLFIQNRRKRLKKEFCLK